jgi:hypothetical protein
VECRHSVPTVARKPHYEVCTQTKYQISRSDILKTASVETLQAETQSLGIKTLLVEPGFFRTELLNSNNARYAETNIDDYRPLTDGLFKQFKQYHHQQPGDPAKGVQRIIDVVNGENEAAGKEFPTTLALGPDAVDAIRKKCSDTLKLLEEWESLSSSTNFD